MRTLACFVLLWLLCGCAMAQAPVAIDTLAARQLSAYWNQHPGDSLACLYGSRDSTGVVVIDSTSQLANACGGPGIIGAMGFLYADSVQEAEVTEAMTRVLAVQRSWLLAGLVHAVVPCQFYGRWMKCPLVYGAVRLP